MDKHADTPSLAATDKVGAAGAGAPRISLDYIKSQIAQVYYIDGEPLARSAHHTDWHAKGEPDTRSLRILTICMVVMKNGFLLLGKSAPLSPDNYDMAKGRTFAYEDALRQTWPLFAFGQLQVAFDERDGADTGR